MRLSTVGLNSQVYCTGRRPYSLLQMLETYGRETYPSAPLCLYAVGYSPSPSGAYSNSDNLQHARHKVSPS